MYTCNRAFQPSFFGALHANLGFLGVFPQCPLATPMETNRTYMATVHQRHGRTDEQTDGQTTYYSNTAQ